MLSKTIFLSAGAGISEEVRAWSEDPLTARARLIWSSGDFLPIARSFSRGAEEFISRLALRPDERVLDVACGTGNLAIPAAASLPSRSAMPKHCRMWTISSIRS